jgi:hypothetical protein
MAVNIKDSGREHLPMNSSDLIAVRNVLADYSFAFDRSDWKLFDKVFDDDSIWVNAVGNEFVGVSEIVQALRSAQRPFADLHQFFNLRLKELDNRTIEAESNWMYHAKPTEQAPWQVLAAGIYRDVLVRGQAGWRLRYRRISDFAVTGVALTVGATDVPTNGPAAEER